MPLRYYTPRRNSKMHTSHRLPSFLAFSASRSLCLPLWRCAKGVTLKTGTIRSIRAPFSRRSVVTTSCQPAPKRPDGSLVPKVAEKSPTLTWNEYFQLRQGRKEYSIKSAYGFSAVSLITGMTILFRLRPEIFAGAMGATVGMHPMIEISLWSLGLLGCGGMVGSIIGPTVWSLPHRSRMALFNAVSRLPLCFVCLASPRSH